MPASTQPASVGSDGPGVEAKQQTVLPHVPCCCESGVQQPKGCACVIANPLPLLLTPHADPSGWARNVKRAPAPALLPPAPAPRGAPSAALDAINARRAAHGAPALSWDAGLAAGAAAWAAACPGRVSGASGIGESVERGAAGLVEAVEGWYGEVRRALGSLRLAAHTPSQPAEALRVVPSFCLPAALSQTLFSSCLPLSRSRPTTSPAPAGPPPPAAPPRSCGPTPPTSAARSTRPAGPPPLCAATLRPAT
jgi:hypothetical protein